jgi:hypothetical protein
MAAGNYGPYVTPELPFLDYGQGIATPSGIFMPPGRVAAYVRSSGRQDYDHFPESIPFFTTVQDALLECRSALGDTVVILPGHTESITGDDGWSNLKAGTCIRGVGHGTIKPTFNFTATASQLDIDVANVSISGCRFNVDGANGVVKALNVTGADFSFIGNEVRVANTTNEHCEIAVEIGTGAHRFVIAKNHFFGIVGEPITDGILVAAAANDGYIGGNNMQFASVTGAAASLIRVSAAALGMTIEHNTLYNTVAASDYAIVLGDVASKGVCQHNKITVLTNDVPTGLGISIGTSSLFGFFDNRVTTNVKVSGELAPVVDA